MAQPVKNPPKPFIEWPNPRIHRRVRSWFIPAAYIAAALVLGRVMPDLDRRIFQDLGWFSAATAASLLSAIASGMISFTGFVFTMTLLFIQFGSSAYSPRLTRYLLSDKIVLNALGMFTATFIYAMIALAFIDLGQTSFVSDGTLLVALLGVLGSVVLFLALIERVSVLQVTDVLRLVGDRARAVIDRQYPEKLASPRDGQDPPAPGEDAPDLRPHTGHPQGLPAVSQTVIYHGGPLNIIEIDIPALVHLAASVDGLIEINYPVGDNVVEGSPLMDVHGGARRLDEGALVRAVEVGSHREPEKDPKYAIRIVVDIGVHALSAAINDPTTAVQALDQIEDLLRRIGTRRLDVGYAHDRGGALRVIYPTPTWEDYLDLSLHEIRLYGASSFQVMRRLRALLEDLLAAVPPERQALVREHMRRMDAAVARAFPDLEDRGDAAQADRQGIGLSGSR